MKKSILAAIFFLLTVSAAGAASPYSGFNCICAGPSNAVATGGCSGFSASVGLKVIGVYTTDINKMLTASVLTSCNSVGWCYNPSTGWMCGKSSPN